jgi:hypothetical protein
MNIAILLVVVAILSLIVVLRFALSRSLQISPHSSLGRQIQPLDVEAFRNLADPAEDEFLRMRLTRSEYWRVRRVRLRALARYVQAAAANAVVLIQIGQRAIHSTDSNTANAARELVDDALLLRRNATVALCRIYIAIALPSAGFAAAPILVGYQRLNGSAMLLGRLQNPATPVRIAAS